MNPFIYVLTSSTQTSNNPLTVNIRRRCGVEVSGTALAAGFPRIPVASAMPLTPSANTYHDIAVTRYSESITVILRSLRLPQDDTSCGVQLSTNRCSFIRKPTRLQLLDPLLDNGCRQR